MEVAFFAKEECEKLIEEKENKHPRDDIIVFNLIIRAF